MKVFENEPVYNKTELSNGVCVVSEHHHESRATTIGVFVPFGTRDEDPSMIGSSHFVEHMVFKGTKSRSAFDIVASLEAVGGELNAYTSREYVCFHATTLHEDFELALDVLSDIMMASTFSEEEFEKERQVILSEIDMSADNLEEYIFDLYFERAFGKHPLSRPILGTPESLAAIEPAQLKSFYDNQFSGAPVIVSIAGSVDHDKAVKQIEKAFSTKKTVAKPSKREAAFAGGFSEFQDRNSEQVHILMGQNAAAYQAANRFDSYIINAVLGGGMTSRLYQKIREDRGLAYSVYSYLHSFTDSGLMVVYAGTTPELVEQTMDIVHEEFLQIFEKGLPEKDIAFFRRQVKGQILLGADDIENRMNSLGVNEMVFGEYRPVSHVLNEIDSVSQDSVKTYMSKYMNPSNFGVYLLGNLEPDVANEYMKKYQ
ncbi:MAG: insulinase family protein [Bdellovibrionales bacterium]|nr:insulinase family protein [Bdellovibrionales bacterium]